ncbi:inorganic diphosphatase [Nocardia sp. NPDC050630]|uniref:inorganic diphosphatase n=1 Tax=Nocardia sp. NPDC050630 TaxID=3364321 RepID=UPI0037B897C2
MASNDDRTAPAHRIRITVAGTPVPRPHSRTHHRPALRKPPPSCGFRYIVNYGFVPGTLAPDGEELDAYFLGPTEPITAAAGACIAIIHRLYDDDDKLIVVPPELPTSMTQRSPPPSSSKKNPGTTSSSGHDQPTEPTGTP